MRKLSSPFGDFSFLYFHFLSLRSTLQYLPTKFSTACTNLHTILLHAFQSILISPLPPPTLAPSICLLSSIILTTSLINSFPAIFSSILSGGIAPFMTYVVGQAFNAFAQFPLTPNPPQSAKSTLLHDVGIAALELLGLAFGSFALGSLTSSLWIWTGEMNVVALRKRVYTAVTQKDMVWLDTIDQDGHRYIRHPHHHPSL